MIKRGKRFNSSVGNISVVNSGAGLQGADAVGRQISAVGEVLTSIADSRSKGSDTLGSQYVKTLGEIQSGVIISGADPESAQAMANDLTAQYDFNENESARIYSALLTSANQLQDKKALANAEINSNKFVNDTFSKIFLEGNRVTPNDPDYESELDAFANLNWREWINDPNNTKGIKPENLDFVVQNMEQKAANLVMQQKTKLANHQLDIAERTEINKLEREYAIELSNNYEYGGLSYTFLSFLEDDKRLDTLITKSGMNYTPLNIVQQNIQSLGGHIIDSIRYDATGKKNNSDDIANELGNWLSLLETGQGSVTISGKDLEGNDTNIILDRNTIGRYIPDDARKSLAIMIEDLEGKEFSGQDGLTILNNANYWNNQGQPMKFISDSALGKVNTYVGLQFEQYDKNRALSPEDNIGHKLAFASNVMIDLGQAPEEITSTLYNLMLTSPELAWQVAGVINNADLQRVGPLNFEGPDADELLRLKDAIIHEEMIFGTDLNEKYNTIINQTINKDQSLTVTLSDGDQVKISTLFNRTLKDDKQNDLYDIFNTGTGGSYAGEQYWNRVAHKLGFSETMLKNWMGVFGYQGVTAGQEKALVQALAATPGFLGYMENYVNQQVRTFMSQNGELEQFTFKHLQEVAQDGLLEFANNFTHDSYSLYPFTHKAHSAQPNNNFGYDIRTEEFNAVNEAQLKGSGYDNLKATDLKYMFVESRVVEIERNGKKVPQLVNRYQVFKQSENDAMAVELRDNKHQPIIVEPLISQDWVESNVLTDKEMAAKRRLEIEKDNENWINFLKLMSPKAAEPYTIIPEA